MAETARPVVLTTVTTAIGLFSFMLVGVQALSGFGLFAGLASLLACVMTFVVTAVILSRVSADAVVPPAFLGQRRLINRVASFCVALTGRHGGKVILLTLLLGLVSLYGVQRLKLSHDTLDWIPSSWTEIRGLELIDHHFGSASSYELVVDSGAPGGVRSVAFVSVLADLARDLRQGDAAEVFSLAQSVQDYLADISRAMDGEVLDYRNYTNGDELVWRDMRFFQIGMPEAFASMVSRDYRYARMTVGLSREQAMESERAREVLDAVVARHGGAEVVEVTGFLPMLRQTLDIIHAGAILSFVVSLLMIFLLLLLFFRNFSVAMLTMLPNVVPIVFVLALLAVAGVRLDMITIMIGSLIIGVIVDDTIHFLSNFRHAQQAGQSVPESCEHALQTSGHAMLATSLVLMGAFAVLGMSQLGLLSLFALISVTILALGLAADFLLMPAIMQWLQSGRLRV